MAFQTTLTNAIAEIFIIITQPFKLGDEITVFKLYIHGVLPSEFNFEHPPLAKFFIGFSEVLFKSNFNECFIQLSNINCNLLDFN